MYNVTVHGQYEFLHENTRYLYAHVENDLDLY